MAKILSLLYENIYLKTIEARDTRIEHYFLLGSPVKCFAIMGIYLYFVQNLGPKIMKDRPAFELKNVLIVYNSLQIIINFVLFILSGQRMLARFKELHCAELNYTETGFYEAQISYCFYLLKIFDLFDTIFFVLRKKWNQLTFLHIYHHVMLVFAAYLNTQYLPGGQSSIVGVVNSFVHVFMYYYYLMSSFSPEMKKSIWWKKYMTIIQMIQFILIIGFTIVPLSVPNCNFPKPILFALLTQNIFFLILFADFYRRTYIKKKD